MTELSNMYRKKENLLDRKLNENDMVSNDITESKKKLSNPNYKKTLSLKNVGLNHKQSFRIFPNI